MKKKHAFAIILVLAAGGVFINAIFCDKKKAPAKVEEPALIEVKNFTLTDLNGEKISLSDYRGKVVILDFWATWCPPCVKEIPHFNELALEYADSGLAVLGVSVDREGAETVRKFQAGTKMSYPVVMYNQPTYDEYQSYLPKDQQGGIPFTFVIDREGRIRNYYVGYRSKEVFIEVITPLL